MKKFVFLYNPVTEYNEDMKKEWMQWFQKVAPHSVDGGNPLVNGHSVTEAGVEALTPDKVTSSGYSIINAEDMGMATELAKGCPGGVKVYEALSM